VVSVGGSVVVGVGGDYIFILSVINLMLTLLTLLMLLMLPLLSPPLPPLLLLTAGVEHIMPATARLGSAPEPRATQPQTTGATRTKSYGYAPTHTIDR
jgi:hypothetical protein